VQRFNSITSRVITLHVIAIAVTSLCMPLALYLLLSSTATDLQHRALRKHADTIASFLEARSDGAWRLDLPPRVRDLYSESYGRYAYAILDAPGHVLFSSLGSGAEVFPNDPHLPGAAFFERQRGGALFYGASIPEAVSGHRLWIQVAQDLEHRDVLIDDIVADFFLRIGWITVPILFSLLVIDILIFRQALRPVLEASEMAQAVSPARIELRLPTAGMPREIVPLVDAVNQAFDRLERGFRIQREFTADAAHELRTPLTILRMRVDMLGDQEAARALRGDIDAMSRIVGQLLDIAELENFVVDPVDRADLQSVCAEVVGFLAPLALAQGKNIALTGETAPVWIRGNPETLFQAIRNLAENAISHTAPDTTVEIDVDASGKIRVQDKGPGVPAGERELIFRRFWRRDRRRAGSAGLGLSIVSRIVEAHGGSISVGDAPGGGAVFTVTFPATVLSPTELEETKLVQATRMDTNIHGW
jgi:signal transduction histidine kinase